MANIVNSSFLAKFFKRDIRTIQLWAKEGMPKEGRDKYDFVKVVSWRINYLENKLKEAEGSGGVLKSAKERKEAALAEKAEFELALLKKELIKVDDVIYLFDRIFNLIKTKLPLNRKKIIPNLLIVNTDKEAEKILETRDNELLFELSESIENIIRSLAKSDDQDEDIIKTTSTTRKRKTERVG